MNGFRDIVKCITKNEFIDLSQFNGQIPVADRKIGSGSFSEIWSCTNRNQVIKRRLKTQSMYVYKLGNKFIVPMFLLEFLSNLLIQDFPSTTSMYDALFDPQEDKEYIVSMVFERLDSAVEDMADYIDLQTIKSYLSQLCSISYRIRSKGITHYDCHMGNVMISSSGSLKLIDFEATEIKVGDITLSYDEHVKKDWVKQSFRSLRQAGYQESIDINSAYPELITFIVSFVMSQCVGSSYNDWLSKLVLLVTWLSDQHVMIPESDVQKQIDSLL